jgi:hypothetical protein
VGVFFLDRTLCFLLIEYLKALQTLEQVHTDAKQQTCARDIFFSNLVRGKHISCIFSSALRPRPWGVLPVSAFNHCTLVPLSCHSTLKTCIVETPSYCRVRTNLPIQAKIVFLLVFILYYSCWPGCKEHYSKGKGSQNLSRGLSNVPQMPQHLYFVSKQDVCFFKQHASHGLPAVGMWRLKLYNRWCRPKDFQCYHSKVLNANQKFPSLIPCKRCVRQWLWSFFSNCLCLIMLCFICTTWVIPVYQRSRKHFVIVYLMVARECALRFHLQACER